MVILMSADELKIKLFNNYTRIDVLNVITVKIIINFRFNVYNDVKFNIIILYLPNKFITRFECCSMSTSLIL